MATFRFEVNNKPTKNKTYNILLCITTDGKRKRLKTSIDIKRRSDFNPKAKQDNWIRPAEPNYKAWNVALASELEKASIKPTPEKNPPEYSMPMTQNTTKTITGNTRSATAPLPSISSSLTDA